MRKHVLVYVTSYDYDPYMVKYVILDKPIDKSFYVMDNSKLIVHAPKFLHVI